MAEPAPDPVHGISEDPLVVKSLSLIHVGEIGDVAALELVSTAM
ncbi:hypothetical protein OIU91_05055 [Streptomyces sp. NBC_01456]|nr:MULTISPECIES: hypothetical protein [unclassified Streptomyces]